MDNSYDKTKLFNFNLIPPKSKAELSILEERDDSIVYSFLLIFFGVFIFFILNLIQTFLIVPKVTSTQNSIDTQNATISTYDTLKVAKGELFIKSQALEPILLNDIKLTQLLDVSKEILDKAPIGTFITSYSREADGTFVLSFSLKKYEDVPALITEIKDNTKVQGTFVRTLIREENTVNDQQVANIRATISFSLSSLNNKNG